MSSELSVERLALGDVPEALSCLERLGPSIAGLAHRSLYRAVIEDAAGGGNPVIVVARTSAGLVGVSMAFLDPPRYALAFATHHPVVTSRVLVARLLRLIRGRPRSSNGTGDGTETALEAWPPAPQQPGAAYLLFTGALPVARGQGVGTGLIAGIGAALAAAGARHAYTRVDAGNEPSLRMCESAGWIRYREGDQFRLHKDLSGGTPR
jgi:GNAT superfamily N-acetyltransferase